MRRCRARAAGRLAARRRHRRRRPGGCRRRRRRDPRARDRAARSGRPPHRSPGPPRRSRRADEPARPGRGGGRGASAPRPASSGPSAELRARLDHAAALWRRRRGARDPGQRRHGRRGRRDGRDEATTWSGRHPGGGSRGGTPGRHHARDAAHARPPGPGRIRRSFRRRTTRCACARRRGDRASTRRVSAPASTPETRRPRHLPRAVRLRARRDRLVRAAAGVDRADLDATGDRPSRGPPRARGAQASPRRCCGCSAADADERKADRGRRVPRGAGSAHRHATRAALHVPPGHPYSPIPAREDVERAVRRAAASGAELPGIDLRADDQLRAPYWAPAAVRRPPRLGPPRPRTGSAYDNTWFTYADAICCALLLRHLRPARLVEVGCGLQLGAGAGCGRALPRRAHPLHLRRAGPRAAADAGAGRRARRAPVRGAGPGRPARRLRGARRRRRAPGGQQPRAQGGVGRAAPGGRGLSRV